MLRLIKRKRLTKPMEWWIKAKIQTLTEVAFLNLKGLRKSAKITQKTQAGIMRKSFSAKSSRHRLKYKSQWKAETNKASRELQANPKLMFCKIHNEVSRPHLLLWMKVKPLKKGRHQQGLTTLRKDFKT